jgi:hypothetical protein
MLLCARGRQLSVLVGGAMLFATTLWADPTYPIGVIGEMGQGVK